MPTTRKRKARYYKNLEIKPWQIQFFKDGLYPLGKDDEWEKLDFYCSIYKNPDTRQKLYETLKKEFLKDWITKHPCSRPWAWYEFDAPRWDDPDINCFWHGKLSEPRIHISGGKQIHAGHVPVHYKSVSQFWQYDEDDPPIFESEAAFLKRLGILTGAEEKYLESHPELLEPDSITDVIPGIKSQK